MMMMIIIILPHFNFVSTPPFSDTPWWCPLARCQDCEAHILGRDPHGTVTAVCALPMDPDSRSPGFLDWIWLGVSSGDMFGILLEESLGECPAGVFSWEPRIFDKGHHRTDNNEKQRKP